MFSCTSEILAIFIVLIIAPTSSASSYDESPLQNVTAVMEGKVLLPCNISTNIEDDQPVLILFYRNSTGTPIYTVDLRSRRRSHVAHMPQSMLKNRADFELRKGKSGLLLRNVWSSDDGLYRCRVDFKKSPTRNSRIYLTVIVPPDSVRILDQTGSEKSSTIGPYVLGQTLALTCVARGGRPPPRLTWWADHKPVTGSIRITGDEVLNTLTIPSLQRHHIHQSFICQASNDKLAIPVTAAVTVEMTLPPMKVTIRGLSKPISAGVGVTVACEVIGARPAPTVTWLLDGKPLRTLGERTRDSGNMTESTVVLQVTKDDQGRHLACRAETPGLIQSVLEKEVKLNVHYVPSVRISIDPRVDTENIREGNNVYLTCSVNAVPPATAISWYHNGILLNPNSSVGVIVSNVSLVLQKTSRFSSGSYLCKAHNAEGSGQSKPVTIRIKFAPVCSSKQKLLYGVARGEQVNVLCRVDAHPPQVFFEWHFNNSVELKKIPDTHITNNWTASKLTYTPQNRNDYGYLICSSSNAVGLQKDPCVYKIFPAGPPDTLKNCSVINESLDSVEVRCSEGFDGGLPQSFIMEVFETRERKLKSNVTSKSPSFTVRGLPSELPLTIRLYAANAKGRSPVSVLTASTASDRAEKRTSVVPASELPSTMERYPSLTIILGVIGGIMIVFVIIVVVMVVRRPRRVPNRPSIQQDDSSLHILKKEDSHTGRVDNDEKDPDVIPEARGNRADGCDRPVSDVSTLYGEMVTQSPTPNTHAHIHQDPANGIHPNSRPAQSASPATSSTHFTPPPVDFQGNHTPTSRQPECLPSSTANNNNNTPPVTVAPMPQNHHQQRPIQQNLQGHLFQSKGLHPSQHPNQPQLQKQQSLTSALYAQVPSAQPSVIPPSYTQTLPHPRSSHGRGLSYSAVSSGQGNKAYTATLVRRGSLYMDPYLQPLATPLAPPPPYNSLDNSPDMVAIVPMVSETVRITPNCGSPSTLMSPPPDRFPPKNFPSSFGNDKDRMESSV